MSTNFYDKVANKFGRYHTSAKYTKEYPAGEPEKIFKEKLLELGGKQDSIFSEPVRVLARVKAISDGRFVIEGHMGKKLSINMGKTAVLKVGGLRIVISEHKGPVHEQNIYKNVGLDPEDAKIVVVKSPIGFRAAYEPIAKKILLADCSGLAPSNLNLLTYKKVPRPLFPLDKLEYWEP